MSDRNLELLHEAKAELTNPERGEFDSYLIGVLSNRLPEEEWKTAIRVALQCCAEAKKRRDA